MSGSYFEKKEKQLSEKSDVHQCSGKQTVREAKENMERDVHLIGLV